MRRPSRGPGAGATTLSGAESKTWKPALSSDAPKFQSKDLREIQTQRKENEVFSAEPERRAETAAKQIRLRSPDLPPLQDS